MLDGDLMASLGGWCAKCMVRPNDRGHRDECVDPSFPVVDKIRSGRLAKVARTCAEPEVRPEQPGEASCGGDG